MTDLRFPEMFATHGVEWERETETDTIGTCPWCGKEGHFTLQIHRGVWQCFKCVGKAGNQYSFLGMRAADYAQELAKCPQLLAKLAEDRGLPEVAFRAWDIGWDGSRYTLPTWSQQGITATDIRVYALAESKKRGTKARVKSTPGCKLGLFGGWRLVGLKPGSTVWVAEGEWDAIALRWVFQKVGKGASRDLVVGVPGAKVWKPAWTDLLRGHHVCLAYDHDAAGEMGDRKAWEHLTGHAASIRSIHWPGEVPTGWDVRDWVVKGAVERRIPRRCVSVLKSLLEPRPVVRAAEGSAVALASAAGQPHYNGTRMTRAELVAAYRQWLHLEDEDMMSIVFGTVLGNRLHWIPLWTFVVTPPGGCKSQMLMALGDVEDVFALSSMSGRALVSGDKNGDPSLLPLLNNKVLCVKDFTPVLTMDSRDRALILGQLRDAFDGCFYLRYGNGVVRDYRGLHFGVLAGVTPALDVHLATETSLGERFIRFQADRVLSGREAQERALRALKNAGASKDMELALKTAAVAFLGASREPPRVSAEVQNQIAWYAGVTAWVRGTVSRDSRTPWLQAGMPFHEVPTRLVQQYSTLAAGVSQYYEETEVGEKALRMIRRVATDSMPDLRMVVLREVARKQGQVTPAIQSRITQVSESTVARTIADLEFLGILRHVNKRFLHLNESVREFFLRVLDD